MIPPYLPMILWNNTTKMKSELYLSGGGGGDLGQPRQFLLSDEITKTEYNNIFKNKDVCIIYKIKQ